MSGGTELPSRKTADKRRETADKCGETLEKSRVTTEKRDTSSYRYAPDAPVSVLKGVGEQVMQRLAKLGIVSLQDLLMHLPLRYEDRTRVLPIAQLQPGSAQACQGVVVDKRVNYGKKRTLLVTLADDSGEITLRFFHFSKAQQDNLSSGKVLRCFGEVSFFQQQRQMLHPEYQFVDGVLASSEDSPAYTPVYPTTEGLGQHSFRRLFAQLIDAQGRLQVGVSDCLHELWQDPHYPDLASAIVTCHQPAADLNLNALNEGQHAAQLRLAFEELLAHRLSLQKLRAQRAHCQAIPLHLDSDLSQRFLQQLPFELTSAQQRVIAEICQDVAQNYPMQRLIQGDVGSGKTVVAAMAALCALSQGLQVLIMAPTEILAEQHYRQFETWMSALQIPVYFLTGKMSAKQRRDTQAAIMQNPRAVIIGTHALFQEQRVFQQVALVIVDEQHRFGVHQRLSLMQKAQGGGRSGGSESSGNMPHQLIMTATPIPRTLTMTAYADLDCSVIDELPPGRLPVETVVLSERKRADVVQRVYAFCSSGKQAYWVCTLIEESEVLQCQAAQTCAEELQAVLSDLRVGMIHGRLPAAEKADIMRRFKQGEIDLLVATTVIEVGVDVANASLMVIENADRLGLSQLHQLRGRVGRGDAQSHCVLMYQAPISQQARNRLNVMRETNDGFEVAQHDLEIRGPGELLGTRQTGLFQLRIADLRKHQPLLTPVARVAEIVLSHPACSESLIRRWIGKKQLFAQV